MKGRVVLKWAPDAPPAENAARWLPLLAKRYFALGRKVVTLETPPSELHRFRLETKRFRYTLEVFRSVYGPALERKLICLRKVQHLLGEVNDAEAAMELLEGQQRIEPAAAQIKESLRQRQGELIQSFVEYWEKNLAGESAEREWTRYLARYARNLRPQSRAYRPKKPSA